MSKLVVPARGKFEGMGELIAFAGAKFKRGGSVGDSTESKLRVVKLLADKVGAVRRRIRSVGGGGSLSGERGRVLKEKQGIRIVVKGVRDGWCGSFDSVDVVTAMMVDGRAKVKCAVAVVGPARAGVWTEMGDAQLARGVNGMGTEVKFMAMQSVEGGDFSRGGSGGGPRTEHVEGEFSGREEEVPKVGGEGDVGGCKTGDEVVFGSAHGTFGSESTMLAGGGKGDSDVG